MLFVTQRAGVKESLPRSSQDMIDQGFPTGVGIDPLGIDGILKGVDRLKGSMNNNLSKSFNSLKSYLVVKYNNLP